MCGLPLAPTVIFTALPLTRTHLPVSGSNRKISYPDYRFLAPSMKTVPSGPIEISVAFPLIVKNLPLFAEYLLITFSAVTIHGLPYGSTAILTALPGIPTQRFCSVNLKILYPNLPPLVFYRPYIYPLAPIATSTNFPGILDHRLSAFL